MDFVLLEPPTYATGRRVALATGKKSLVHFNDRIAEQCPFSWFDLRNVSSNSIT
jgi:hypothetical protein